MFYWREKARVLSLFSFLIAAVSLLFFGCNSNDITGNGNKPTIAGMTPASAVAGQQNVNGHITGTNFKGIVAVDLGAGIDVKDTQLVSETEITVRFSLHQDAAPGAREIKVATIDGIATSSTVFSVSDNHVPVASFAVVPDHGGLTTNFSFDASASNDPDGSVQSYAWDFGDGNTGSGKTIEHKFNSATTFHVKLSVKDNHDATAEATRDVRVENIRPPVARFTVSPSHGDSNTNFEFNASNSTDDKRVVRWSWNFGDGTSDQGRRVHHHFQHANNFNVTLTVTDNDDLTDTTERTVEVRGKLPVAEFSVTPSFGDVNTTFLFDGSPSTDSDGVIVSYDWAFGDGATASGKNVQHKYASNGDRNVQLSVTDNDGQKSSRIHDVAVDPPVPVGGVECTQPAYRPRTGLYGTILSVDKATSSAVIKLYEDNNCATAFFKCGDFDSFGETRYYGAICRMIYYGNNTFRVFTINAKATPTPGEQNVFLKWQTCSPTFKCP